jgi:hypothetical protein
MSYTLAFWAGGDDLDPDQTYLAFADDLIAGVGVIDSAAVEQAIADRLVGWTRDANILQPPGSDPDSGPAFDVSIGIQLAQFTGYGITDGEHFNAIIDAMHPLGFRLYDPQTRERFA